MLAIASILSRVGTLSWSGHRWRQRWAYWLRRGLLLSALLGLGSGLSACRESAIANPRHVAIDQTWELEAGDQVAGYRVAASLGDITIQTDGAVVRAPFTGEVEQAASGTDCVFFSSPEVPAYLFRFCGLRQPRLGSVAAGDRVGRAKFLHFATLRRQPEGTWVIVEPSEMVLERSLVPAPR
ncbi:MAG: hypothetical protein IGR92_03265 [Leptolyngbyaceae cyanobacterium T60_A2020_046]|nr:hypothetical protein [Leptolyngbyaceae cyanobacterium T60_A2020_046]